MESKEKTLVSIIVPCYNVEQYLPKCIESILAQSYQNLEIWLVDDGSPDRCGEICDAYVEKDKRIKVIHKENGGLADARNAAIDRATGEWITFVDSDDTISVDYVQTLFDLVERNKCKVGAACLRTFNEGEAPDTGQPIYRECVFSNMQGLKKMFYQELFDTTAPVKVYHKSMFATGIRFPKGFIYEDLATVYLLFLQADRIAYCNRIVYNYLLRKGSLEGQPFNKRKLDSALQIMDMIQSHAAELKPIEKAVRCRLFSFCFHVLLEMPEDYPDTRKQVLQDYVQQNRWKVLMDARARKKARFAAVLSFLGMNAMKHILRRVNKRKK